MKMEEETLGAEDFFVEDSLILRERFVILNELLLLKGARVDELKSIALGSQLPEDWAEKTSELGAKELAIQDSSYSISKLRHLFPTLVGFFVLAIAVTGVPKHFDSMIKAALATKCVLPNNYIVWEATRPVTNCLMCANLTEILVLDNVKSREDFKPYAYSSRPILVKGAAASWPARQKFDFLFFKRLFEKYPDAFKSVEEDCQFLNFKSDFRNLEEVFAMPSKRWNNPRSHEAWYIGWSNCHPEVLKEMKKLYSKPNFLPEEAEHSHIDFVFMGYQQGAYTHLDYISRLMWQAQLRGHKIWRLTPPPECDSICSQITFTISPGDILLLDTRQWYHDTRIVDGEFSITVSSEYG